jgi:ribonuclease P/MRP protein subunit RPP1
MSLASAFHNLNVPHHATSVAQVKSVVELNRTSAEMRVLALNATHSSAAGVPLAQSAQSALQSTNEAIQQCATNGGDLTVLRRLTVVLSDTRQLHEMSLLSDLMVQFDLVALRPTDEKTFRGACCDCDSVDIVALALDERLSFSFKHSTVSVALHRSVFFEIDVAPLFRATTADARRSLLGQAVALVRATRGRNIILTCSGATLSELRTGADLANLGRVLGLNREQAHAAVTRGAARCVQRGRFRCSTRNFGVVEVRERTARDDIAFGIDADDDDEDEESDNDDDNVSIIH